MNKQAKQKAKLNAFGEINAILKSGGMLGCNAEDVVKESKVIYDWLIKDL